MKEKEEEGRTTKHCGILEGTPLSLQNALRTQQSALAYQTSHTHTSHFSATKKKEPAQKKK